MKRKRADIQGLRAIAVLLVVAYHAGLDIPGGFTGVDVFFVISGFVITKTLTDELDETGSISLAAFYRRRVKRLLPGLAMMVTAVAILATLANPIGSLRTTALTGMWASVFSANAFLYRLGAGYFDVSATLDPLLHTWTLAVEEQFYVVFPAVLLLTWWIGRRGTRGRPIALATVAAVSILSFVLSLELSRGRLVAAAHRPEQIAFYSSPTRAWEFGAGALLALAAASLRRQPRWLAEPLAAGGAAAVLYGAFSIPGTGSFPGTAALYPVLGTAAVVAAGTARTTVASWLLGLRPFVWIGDRSYSWYLWHWPLIVFAKALFPGAGWAAPVAAAISLVPAAASYRWIENPIRFNRGIRGRRVLAVAAVSVLLPVAACAGLLGVMHALDRTAAIRDWNQSRAPHLDELRGCEGSTPFGTTTPQGCTWRVAHARGTIVLIGDSNASHFAEGVIRAGNRAHYDVTLATFFGCPFVDLEIVGSSAGEGPCKTFESESLSGLIHAKPTLVVTAARTDEYIDGHIALGAPGADATTTNSGRRATLWQTGLTTVLTRLNRSGIPVLVVDAVPEITRLPTDCAVLLVLRHACGGTTGRASVDKALKTSLAVQAAAIAAAGQSRALDLEDAFCSASRCFSNRQGKLLYRDTDHLSIAGAVFLTDRLYRAIVASLRRNG